jgi:hypothetical protein
MPAGEYVARPKPSASYWALPHYRGYRAEYFG